MREKGEREGKEREREKRKEEIQRQKERRKERERGEEKRKKYLLSCRTLSTTTGRWTDICNAYTIHLHIFNIFNNFLQKKKDI